MKRTAKPASGKRRRSSPPPRASEEMAAHQRQIRQEHSQERAQDYVEAIADLICERGEARAIDLARVMGVSHVTVIRTIARIKKSGLVTTEPYRSIFLTPAGKKLAASAKMRHRVVVEFLEALGVPLAAAKADAEGIEHHVSPETLYAFQRFIASRNASSPTSDSLKTDPVSVGRTT